MSKVYASDLSSANSSYMVTCLKDAEHNMQTLTSKLQSFNTSSVNELVGAGYDGVRAKMSLYIDCFQKLTKICTNLIAAIPNGNNSLLNYMEGYAELDDSKISEVEAELKRAKSYLSWLKSYHTETDSKGNSKNVRNGTDAEISSCEALIAKLEKYLEKLRNLASADTSAFSEIDAVKSDIAAFAKALSEIRIPNFDGTMPTDEECFFGGSLSSFSPKTGGQKNYYSFDQTDPRWQNSGYRSVDGNDIAAGGCGPCSMAAALATILNDDSITPYTVGSVMGQNGWTNYGGNFVPNMANYYGLDCDPNFAAVDNRKEATKNLVENGGAVIVGYKGGGHYVAVVGYDSATDTFIVADSYPGLSGYSDTMYQISYEELKANTADVANGIHGSVWEAVAPSGMSVAQASSSS